MKILDLNLLLHVVNRDAPQHATALGWWERAIESGETIGLPWVVLIGFLRLSANETVFPRPLDVETALERIDGWLSLEQVCLVTEDPGHWEILRELLMESGAAGNLTTDAHLAALAISRGATLVSFDGDFSRFRTLRWERPQ